MLQTGRREFPGATTYLVIIPQLFNSRAFSRLRISAPGMEPQRNQNKLSYLKNGKGTIVKKLVALEVQELEERIAPSNNNPGVNNTLLQGDQPGGGGGGGNPGNNNPGENNTNNPGNETP